MTDNVSSTPEMVTDYKSYKWLISSCFQKSLRRGRFDLAKSYLEFLWEHDRNYITYRFGTILAEDVGIANMALIKEYLDTKLAKKQIDEAGGLEFLIDITQRACESVKDRSSCDAGYISHYYGLNTDISLLSDEDKVAALKTLVLDTTQPYTERINASWLLLGNKKFKHDGLSFLPNHPVNEKGEKIDNLDQYCAAITALGLDEDLTTNLRNAYNSQVENIFLGMPIVQSLYNDELKNQLSEAKLKVGQVIENTYVKEITIHHPATGLELISCGIDGHTREGKGVYYSYLKTSNPFNTYMKEKNVPYDLQMLVFSHCMFRTEGHEVNKRAYFPSAVQIMRDCEQKILDMKLDMGENHLDFNHIKKILVQEIPKINALRIKGIENTPITLIEKVEPKVKKKKSI